VQRELDIEQLDAFVRVACIHNGSYAGAFTGFVIAAVLIVRASRRTLVRP
jgi:hypothetical protein